MGVTSDLGLVWVIYPDQPITRRKWRHLAKGVGTDRGFADSRFGTMIEAILEREPAQIVLKLPNGKDCIITAAPTSNKDLD